MGIERIIVQDLLCLCQSFGSQSSLNVNACLTVGLPAVALAEAFPFAACGAATSPGQTGVAWATALRLDSDWGVALTGARSSGQTAWSRWSARRPYDLDQDGCPALDDGGGEGDARPQPALRHGVAATLRARPPTGRRPRSSPAEALRSAAWRPGLSAQTRQPAGTLARSPAEERAPGRGLAPA